VRKAAQILSCREILARTTDPRRRESMSTFRFPPCRYRPATPAAAAESSRPHHRPNDPRQFPRQRRRPHPPRLLRWFRSSRPAERFPMWPRVSPRTIP